jgi:shikimate dehydrogenase
VGIIGDPVAHSLSPALHNAAFAAAGLDWVYVAFPVPVGQGPDAVAAARALGLAGLSVTMPHKAAVAVAVDRLSDTARRLGAVNTVVRVGDALVGESTDGAGFVEALRQDEGWEAEGRRCVVLGAGGAARAVSLALAEAGAADVAVVGRRAGSAAACAALAGRAGRVGGADEVADADLVVNATPVGMALPSIGPPVRPAAPGAGPAGALPLDVDPDRLGPGQVVADLIYAPPTTPLLVAARARGATTVNGFGMLLHQAGRQFSLWTGQAPPLDVMSAAALAELAERHH